MNGTFERADVWVHLADGTRLHATLWMPVDAAQRPVAVLLEALPYRKDDITASYCDTYEALVVDGGFGVCRVDLRGTGSSSGIATDEYPETEIDDLAQVIRWLAEQQWCTGRVGMFGTSYSGFNSLHLAAAGVAELGAVCAMYSTDDRFTDDVHFHGGALRAIDVVDYVTYMVAMNATPPVPAIWGDGWIDEWRSRVSDTPPWVLRWLSEQTDGDDWRRGSIRIGPNGAGYERISCPTMLIGGWADGYRNNTFRTVAELDVPWRLLLGPWAHKSPDYSRPGPNIRLVAELIGWFDEHLRGGPALHAEPIQVFVREWTEPEPDQATTAGRWRYESGWPLDRSETTTLALGDGIVSLGVRPDVGTAAWNSCAGGLPWGQPLDQRGDDARSVVTDFEIDEPLEILGYPTVALRVASTMPVAHVSAKLCAVAPDGTSALISRGLLNLTHRDCWPVASAGGTGEPEPLEPGTWYDVVVELEATSWDLRVGDRLRLSLAGTDWPNIWPPPAPLTLSFDRAESVLHLPTIPRIENDPATPTPDQVFVPADGPAPLDTEAVWRVEHDILGRATTATTHYGGTYEGTHGAVITDSYDGLVGVSTIDPGDSYAEGRASFCLAWPEATCTTNCLVRVESDARAYHVNIELLATHNGAEIGSRRWTAAIPRHLQ